ncbi:hypothetical protein P170DRAFT_95939 [Aspergillus steynii IBT 23096]|uniref:Secreted protein n=1 Tax=Aspergillus steynii IBT 23096 TaxID=1392250 RepID=A0A2I2GGQ2_9EURO|nr:uncharacterized protein P170DRAFT_95939 [Aspergillus steynii IBT 23096]PLB52061.1 hypothetical protein P170DRAFT_95939 [Aspergillus steynii IBT 23096]
MKLFPGTASILTSILAAAPILACIQDKTACPYHRFFWAASIPHRPGLPSPDTSTPAIAETGCWKVERSPMTLTPNAGSWMGPKVGLRASIPTI